jgi:outer membrane protein TolC
VQPNSIANQLQTRLRALKAELEARSHPTTLQQAIEAALLNNPELAVAYARIQNSQWTLIAVRRQWYPTLRADSINLPRHTFSTITAGGPGIRNTTTFTNGTATGASLTASWTFFDPSRGPAINAAGDTLRQQQLLFDVSARDLVLLVQQTYFRLQEQKQLISSYEEILTNTERQVQLVEAKFNAGLVNISDVEQIRTTQYSILSTLIETTNQLLTNAAQLAETMALPPGGLAMPADQLQVVGSWSESLPATIEQALRLREEIQASLAAASSASWTATKLFNTYWPKFSLGASGNVVSTNSTEGYPAYTSVDSNSLNWSGGVGVGFNWQLFDGGINAANAMASQAQSQLNLQQAAKQRLQVTREVEGAYSAYLTSQLGLQSSSAQAQSARQAVLAAQARFSVGFTDMATVVQTLNQAISAAYNYSSALRTYNTAVAGLYRYSASWPEGSQPLLNQRTKLLRQQ